ncbi:MAG: hypothetical protein H0W50_05375 [Parachlamydiaceae bacterium]|nr:hypothetical protein [Parachlamydiaceae bacterium]
MPGTNSIDNSAEVDKVPDAGGPDINTNMSIDRLLKLIMFEGTEPLRLKKIAQLKNLATAQNEIGFLNNLRRILMLGAEADGSFKVSEELQKLLDKISNPGSEGLMQLLTDLGLEFNATHSDASFNQLFVDIEALPKEEKDLLLNKLFSLGIEKGKKPTEDQLKALVTAVNNPENMALRKHLTKNKILSTKKTFNKAERENFIESIRLAVEQKSTLNEMIIQTTTRLQTEIDQRQQYVIMALKIYNDAKKNINAKIGR